MHQHHKYPQKEDPHEKWKTSTTNLPVCFWFLNVYCIVIYFYWQNAAWIGSFISTEHSKRSSSTLNGQIQSSPPPFLWVPHLSKWVSPPLEGRTTPETQRFTAFTVRATVTNKDLHKEVMQITQEEEVLLPLRGSLCRDDLFSHLSMWANRASVGSKHDKWHRENLEAPSASFWRITVGAYGDKNRDETRGTLHFEMYIIQFWSNVLFAIPKNHRETSSALKQTALRRRNKQTKHYDLRIVVISTCAMTKTHLLSFLKPKGQAKDTLASRKNPKFWCKSSFLIICILRNLRRRHLETFNSWTQRQI